VVFGERLLLLSIIFQGFIHVVARISTSLFFMTKEYSTNEYATFFNPFIS